MRLDPGTSIVSWAHMNPRCIVTRVRQPARHPTSFELAAVSVSSHLSRIEVLIVFMAPSSPRLPAEINFLIINQLAQVDDTAALLSCSLVCRSWLPVARAGLFESIKVVTAANGRLDAFANFLARCRDICPLIRDLTLSCEPAARVQDRKVSERLYWPHFRTMVFMLPRLRSLTLNGISIVSDASDGRFDSDASARPTLRSLRMTGCQLHDVDMTSALDLLRIFSEVDSLSFGGFWSMAHTRPLSTISARTTTIRHVHFDALGAQATQMLCYFIGPPRGNPLRSVHLTWYSWAEVEACRSFLGSCAQNLKHLELEPTDEFWTRRVSSEWPFPFLRALSENEDDRVQPLVRVRRHFG
ncbi:hypothetical protein C8Q73DRAFT_448764 [Cubamyces lactineus]|nr:hypothetical protein C8Q73DRAFT_448764 [Cubamyces lactineus]